MNRAGGAWWLGVSPLALIASACVGSSGAPARGPYVDTPVREAHVSVRNQNFYDATLTAISDTGRRLLGTVGGNRDAVFAMPWSISAGLRVEVDLLAGRTCTTESITVNPGDTVEVQIPPQFDRTPFC